MKNYLLISEKPSLMREVQNAFYKAKLTDIKVDFVALHGHCCTLAAPEDYREDWKQWKMDTIPIIPDKFKHVPIEKDLVKMIKQKIKDNKYDGLINCTDAEREGQNIFYSLYDYIGCTLPVKRYWVSDLSDEKLHDAWMNLKDDQKDPFFVNLTAASLLRANFDWLIGMNFTRVVSITNHKVIPVGRVMSVVLSILAKRELEIKNFKPSTSYDVLANYYLGFDGKYIPEEQTSNGAFSTLAEAEKFISKLKKKAKVIAFEKKETKENAPLLYSLGDLQNDANRLYGYTLSQSLQIIQDLYEKKILSYPRTDSNYLTSGEAKRMPQIVNTCLLVPGMADYKLDKKKITNYADTKYTNDAKVQAHYAIVFTGNAFDFDSLNDSQQNIVTLVAKRILATLMDSAVYSDINIECEIGEGENLFTSSESALISAGWKKIYGHNDEDDIKINLKEGDIIDVMDFDIKTVTTTCPPRYNDASLNKAMINIGSTLEDETLKKILRGNGSKDQGGIGTPATRSAIVEKLLTPKKAGDGQEVWVLRKGKSFYVTDEGLAIADALKNFPVSSAVLTAQWEQKLLQVQDGSLKSSEFEKDMIDFVNTECVRLKSALATTTSLNHQAKTLDVKCPFCGGSIVSTNNYYFCENYKKEKDCKFVISKVTAGLHITNEILKDLCEKHETKEYSFKKNSGEGFKAKLRIDFDEMQVRFARDFKTICKCSCGGSLLLKTGQYGEYVQCDKCKLTINKLFFGHKFTNKEIENLVKGKTLEIKGLKNNSGKEFGAKVILDENKKVKLNGWI